MLKVDFISSGYGKKQILFNISLDLSIGDVLLLTGQNGSGKSTLLKCIYSLLPIWRGAIWYDNERIDTLKPFELIRRGIVYLPQKNFCFDNLTVEENLRIAGTIYSNSVLQDRIENIYIKTGLADFKKRKPFNLSGGERKLLAFGMVLIHEPKLILLDEPLAGVDSNKTERLIAILNSYLKSKNITAIIVEHNGTIKGLVSKTIQMENGTINN